MVLSFSVATRHSRTPVISDRSPAGVEPVPGLLNDEERRRATKRGSDRILEEAVRMRICGDTRVGVDVDRARQHEKPGRVDRLADARAKSTEVRLDGRDPFGR